MSEVMPRRINLAEIRLHMRDGWQPVTAEQQHGKWLDVMMPDGTVIHAHWAQDMSGAEQPPFRGWFRRNGSFMAEIGEPILWKDVEP